LDQPFILASPVLGFDASTARILTHLGRITYKFGYENIFCFESVHWTWTTGPGVAFNSGDGGSCFFLQLRFSGKQGGNGAGLNSCGSHS
jgi:hypothetical protein